MDMDCPECGKPLDVSATKSSYLRCRGCVLLFIVKEDGEMQGLAIRPPDGFDEDDFFASFCRNLGFEDEEAEDDETEDGEAEDAPGAASSAERSAPSGGRVGLLLVGLGLLVALAAVAYWLTRDGV